MDEKKSIKVSLGMVVCIFIIAILLCAIAGLWYYYNYIQNNDVNSDEIAHNNTVNTIGETNNKKTYEETNEPNQKDNSKNIIMYLETNIANTKPGIYSFDYEDEKYEDFYNTTYEIYQNGKSMGKTKGTIKEQFSEMFDATYYYINYDKEEYNGERRNIIFASCNYDVIPRKYENIKDIPSIIVDEFGDCDSLKMQSIDLNGDGKKEYVVAYSNVNESLNEYVSGVYLYDANYKKISMIATQYGYSQYLSDFDYITYIDIDNDENMEIIIDIPVASSYYRFGIYKYEDNSVKGQVDTFGIGG